MKNRQQNIGENNTYELLREFEMQYTEKKLKSHLKWLYESNIKISRQKEKLMLFCMTSIFFAKNFPESFNIELIDLNLIKYISDTQSLYAVDPFIFNLLRNNYHPINTIERFINLHQEVGLSQISFVDLFKLYLFHIFVERKGKEIYFPGLTLIYDEIFVLPIRIKTPNSKKFLNADIISPYLQEGKTLFLSPKTLSTKFFDFLIINNKDCYFFEIKSKLVKHICNDKNLGFLVNAAREFNPQKIRATLSGFKQKITNLMKKTDKLFYSIFISFI